MNIFYLLAPAACGAVLTDSTLTGETQVIHSSGGGGSRVRFIHALWAPKEGQTLNLHVHIYIHKKCIWLETDVSGEIRIFWIQHD